MIFKIEKCNWNKLDGLMPVIIQDASSLQVLMLGYMNNEALRITCETRLVTFYSRSKKRLWTKGETSGNYLHLVRMEADCDQDTLLITVNPAGPACHLNTVSCFADDEEPGFGIFSRLENIIRNRRRDRPENSYTTALFNKGIKRIAQKVGEEGLELALAAVSDTRDEVINEAADLIYHLLVLLRAREVDLMDVMSVLQKREKNSST